MILAIFSKLINIVMVKLDFIMDWKLIKVKESHKPSFFDLYMNWLNWATSVRKMHGAKFGNIGLVIVIFKKGYEK